MAHLGIRVTALHEEEYCLIPMGGVLPRVPQRVLGIGGTAGMVHPSTGGRAEPFHDSAICRVLASPALSALPACCKLHSHGGVSVRQSALRSKLACPSAQLCTVIIHGIFC